MQTPALLLPLGMLVVRCMGIADERRGPAANIGEFVAASARPDDITAIRKTFVMTFNSVPKLSEDRYQSS
jgi:hypothetical protein